MTAVAAGLREWTRSHDLHVRAALWLLLAHVAGAMAIAATIR